jgi:3-oxoacyl-[acyl-carrier-protein] synthase II
VVVTGLGLVTPLSTGVEKTWQGILAGKSGIGPITRFDTASFKTKIAGEVKKFDAEAWLPKKSIRRLDLFIHYAVAAARMALEQAGLPLPLDEERAPRAGCVIGVGLGGLITLEETILLLADKGPDRVSPFFIPRLIGNMAPGEISIEFNLKGPNVCLSTACAAGSHAIGEAFEYIARGAADMILAGGAEAVITPVTVAGFTAVRALSTRNNEPEKASRPFDKDREGFVMSEGAGMMFLESLELAQARGAQIIAEVVGYGLSSDAHHMTAPDPTGAGFSSCMRMALTRAGLKPTDIDYINAHGTSTALNDATETKAIKEVFGEHAYKLAVSSTKSMIGHMLGATGGVEAVLSVLSLRDQVMPPTINYEIPDPECDLDYVPNVKREARLDYVQSNSFGFGGTNASLVFAVWRSQEARSADMRIILGSDHAGFEMKQQVKAHLNGLGRQVQDMGTFNSEAVDYPQIGAAVARAVAEGRADRGILVCGSGEGMCMVANRFSGIRAALAFTLEHALLSRRHNDANILCLGGRFTVLAEALAIVDGFLVAQFEGGRHQRRVDQIEEVSGG